MNANGIQEAGDNGIKDAIVKLYKEDGTFVAETTTDQNGKYLFDKLIPGNYYVEFTTPADRNIPGVGNVS
jgi:uncharacterized surface anchored protein